MMFYLSIKIDPLSLGLASIILNKAFKDKLVKIFKY